MRFDLRSVLVLVLLCIGCAGGSPRPNHVQAENEPSDAVRWILDSAEYDAISIQTYRLALQALDAKLGGRPHDARDAAVVLDIDETVLATLGFDLWVREKGLNFTGDVWNRWVDSRKEPLPALPGAAEFLEAVRARGVKPFFITNRMEVLREATVKNLAALGLAAEDELDRRTLLLRQGKARGKQGRRDRVAETHDVLLYLGDNLADFSEDLEFDRASTVAKRGEALQKHTDALGVDWIVFPNPAYGDWKKVAP